MESSDPVKAIKEIHTMMERSSRFISLSGLSGVFMGIFALAGVAVAYIMLDIPKDIFPPGNLYPGANDEKYVSGFLFADAGAVLVLSLISGFVLTRYRAKKIGLKMWDETAKRLLINLLVPLIAGGIFCLILFFNTLAILVPSVMLMFYGMALLNASKYTLDDIRTLGYLQILLGLIAAIWVSQSLLFWAAGFGFLHIIYGISMYYKYER